MDSSKYFYLKKINVLHMNHSQNEKINRKEKVNKKK